MNPWPKISVITISRDCGPSIGRSIESVPAQGYPNLEHIIMDRGSTDTTSNIVQEHPHVRWVAEHDLGEAAALNKAIRMSTGEIMCWLDAEVLLTPDTLKT